ncbi:MAG: carboxypeptidase regulatory-like domain-containing protein [Bacteroidota bacterium]|nr:carboxypeptidase regulatory-like domain-containing protein [Bacteroidota bacterium]MDP4231806.1 carboxypeptidase regulatory-like domain-containing protein [Bacteroidota bacterium]MDP4242692.1 carboxypeptidase regulatory-like domain-containing protein [Bacteroidota bacterium]MDP4287143.1 carboxypeptidase regulatory-like domain-containing protein [Bacteroidota bacterium]
MKFSRYSIIPFLGAWFVLLALSACRHTSPTEPNPTPNPDSCCNGVISYHLQDSTGSPISGGTIALAGPNSVTRTETTNGDGNAHMVHLCPGRYVIHSSKDGYQTKETVVELTCNDTVSDTITLGVSSHVTNNDCCHGSITLIVHDSATGTALDGGSATLWMNGHNMGSKPMSVHGTVWDGLCPGQYSFSLSKDGYHGTEFRIDSMGCSSVRNVSHTMSSTTTTDCCGGVAEITVIDSSTGHAINDAAVTLNGVSMKTGADGGVRYAHLCPGAYRATIIMDGYSQGVIEFQLGCNQTIGYTKGLMPVHQNSVCDTASLGITVVDSIHQDMRLSDAAVTVRLSGHSDILAQGKTDVNGYFQTPSTLTGNSQYSVTISDDGYHEKTFTWQIGECYTHLETFMLSPQ